MSTLTASFLTSATFIAVLTVASSAIAGNGPTQKTLDPTVVVRYSDLNIDNPEGVRVLYGRLKIAAERVCGGPASSLWYPGTLRKWQACYQSALDTAVAQVNRPMLTDLHHQHSKPSRERSPALAAEQPSSATASH